MIPKMGGMHTFCFLTNKNCDLILWNKQILQFLDLEVELL